MALDDAVWDATVLRNNRDRLVAAEVSANLRSGVEAHPRGRASLNKDVVGGACGLQLQALDLSSCATSNVGTGE